MKLALAALAVVCGMVGCLSEQVIVPADQPPRNGQLMITHRAMQNPPPPATKVYTRSHLPGVLNNSENIQNTASVSLRSHVCADIPTNERVTLLCAFINENNKYQNVTGILGQLSNPMDTSQVLMNLTFQSINERVEHYSEASLSYNFHMGNVLSQPVQMEMRVLYFEEGDDDRLYSNLFFNETVQLVNPLQGSVTVESTFQVLFAVGVIGVVVMVLAGERVMEFISPSKSAAGAAASEQGFGQNLRVPEGAQAKRSRAGKGSAPNSVTRQRKRGGGKKKKTN